MGGLWILWENGVWENGEVLGDGGVEEGEGEVTNQGFMVC